MKRLLSLGMALVLLFCSACAKAADNRLPTSSEGEIGVPSSYFAKDAPLKSRTEDEAEAPAEKAGETRFVSPSEVPSLTVPLGSGTASYSLLRQRIGAGDSVSALRSKAGGEIRTEELLARFDFSCPQPEDGRTLGIASRLLPCPWNGETLLLALTVRTGTEKRAERSNLVFLVDTTGSMADEGKLGLFRRALGMLASQLGKDDTVSVVTHDGRILLEGCAGNDTEALLSAADALAGTGGEAAGNGFEAAYALARNYRIEGGNNRVLPVTDGDLPVFGVSEDDAEAIASASADDGIFLTVLGFGDGNVRDPSMESLACAGGGDYLHIGSDADAREVFGKTLLTHPGLLWTNTALSVTFSPAAVKEYRLFGYDGCTEASSGAQPIPAHSSAGECMTVCFELRPTEKAEEEETWLTFAAETIAPDGSEVREEGSVGFPALREGDADSALLCAVLGTAMLLHQSPYGDITAEGILGLIDPWRDDPAITSDAYKTEFISLLERWRDNGN